MPAYAPDAGGVVEHEFDEDWPDIFPQGLIIARSTVSPAPRTNGPDLEEGEQYVSLSLHVQYREEAPHLAFSGDVVVDSNEGFAAVTVLMPFLLRGEPEDPPASFGETVLERFGPWAAPLVYDHGAMALRSMLAGVALDLDVPTELPPIELHPPKERRAKR
ncbi:hypothetical protein [Nocardioides sp. NPDC004968]|uniref:hypothetical protein n=1 Tax=Nocardioides sp. NPDC004968 TaxID=3155894 RepID=UPI0033A75F01